MPGAHGDTMVRGVAVKNTSRANGVVSDWNGKETDYIVYISDPESKYIH